MIKVLATSIALVLSAPTMAFDIPSTNSNQSLLEVAGVPHVKFKPLEVAGVPHVKFKPLEVAGVPHVKFINSDIA